jgi:hypothetical protein
MQTINLLPTEEGEIIKRTKFGFYAKFQGETKPIFIYYTDTLNESIFEDELNGDDKNTDV